LALAEIDFTRMCSKNIHWKLNCAISLSPYLISQIST